MNRMPTRGRWNDPRRCLPDPYLGIVLHYEATARLVASSGMDPRGYELLLDAASAFAGTYMPSWRPLPCLEGHTISDRLSAFLTRRPEIY